MYNTTVSYELPITEVAAEITPGMVLAACLIPLALIILGIFVFVAWCKMFKKAGQPWERLFVPLYGVYWVYKLALSTKIFWLNLLLPVAYGIASGWMAVSGTLTEEAMAIYGLFVLLGILVMLVMMCVYHVRLAKAYGKGVGFGIGLLLLNPIFILILGFGKSEYQHYDKLSK